MIGLRQAQPDIQQLCHIELVEMLITKTERIQSFADKTVK